MAGDLLKFLVKSFPIYFNLRKGHRGTTGDCTSLDWESAVSQITEKKHPAPWVHFLKDAPQMIYIIPYCFQVSNISACSDNIEALRRKECRKYMNDWRENDVKQNVLFQIAAFSDPDVAFIKNHFRNSKEKVLSSDALQPNSAALPPWFSL